MPPSALGRVMSRLVLLALVALAPLAVADEEQGSTYGANLGYVAPGLWDTYWLSTPGGVVSAALSWAETGVFPFADYDLHLYAPGAFDDGFLEPSELVAESSQHPYAHHDEALTYAAPSGGLYVVAVVPFQAQGETYTLSASPGDLQEAGKAFGYVVYGS